MGPGRCFVFAFRFPVVAFTRLITASSVLSSPVSSGGAGPFVRCGCGGCSSGSISGWYSPVEFVSQDMDSFSLHVLHVIMYRFGLRSVLLFVSSQLCDDSVSSDCGCFLFLLLFLVNGPTNTCVRTRGDRYTPNMSTSPGAITGRYTASSSSMKESTCFSSLFLSSVKLDFGCIFIVFGAAPILIACQYWLRSACWNFIRVNSSC